MRICLRDLFAFAKMSEANMNDYLAIWFAVFGPERQKKRENM